MTREELIIKTENYMKNIPEVKNQIGVIEGKIKDASKKAELIQEEIEILNKEKRLLNIKIEKLKK